MKIIDEQIKWYDENATRRDDDLIKADLKLINNLYEEVEYSEDSIYINKIIGTFCEIIEMQRDLIAELEFQADNPAIHAPAQPKSSFAHTMPQGGFENDKQLQKAFSAYLAYEGKSTYTVNDYCSRLRNIWKSFYNEYKEGGLPDELSVDEEGVLPECPLLNAYRHIDELSCYISMRMAASDEKRNWTNARAALNKFDNFLMKNTDR